MTVLLKYIIHKKLIIYVLTIKKYEGIIVSKLTFYVKR